MAEPSTVGASRPKRAKTGGRKKGTPNKITADLKRAILEALEAAGGDEGTVGYLTRQADENPASFLTLVGKVLPTTLGGDPENPVHVQAKVVREIVYPPKQPE